MESLTFNLHFTDLCNYHCKHCFVNKSGKELSLDEIKIIVDKLVDYKKTHNINIRVNLAGGEPLVSDNIQSIIDYIYESRLDVSIITNGYYLTEEFIVNNSNKLSMIGISVDSINHDTNLMIGRCCKGETLSKDKLVSLFKVIRQNGIKSKINTCITSNNVDEDINELLEEVQPDRIKVLRAYCEPCLSKYNITDEQWENAKKKYTDPRIVFEDNDFMKTGYLIIDSEGNLSKNNLHITNNSVLTKTIDEALQFIELYRRKE